MTPEAFLENFGAVANAPGGVQRLREMILFLGLKGKLTEQRSLDSSAEELLEKIKKFNMEQLRIKGRRINKSGNKASQFLELPKNWVQTESRVLFNLHKGKNPKDLSEFHKKYHYLDIEALDRGNVRRYTDDEKVPRCSEDDILVVCDGSRSGLVLNGKNGVVGSTLAIIETPPFVKAFVKLIFQQGFQRLNSSMKGAAIPHLDTKTLLTDIIGLPPLEEQKRIVAKVDQLMALCDRLEAQQQERSMLVKQSRISALKALADAGGGEALLSAWKRVQDHLPMLFDHPDDVEDLKNVITLLGVQGKLHRVTEGFPDINQIFKDTDGVKQTYYNNKWIRKQKHVNIAESCAQYPSNWGVEKFDDVAVIIGGVTKGRKLSGRKVKEYPYLRVANVQRGFFDLSQIKNIIIPLEEFAKYQLYNGDLLIAEGGDWDKVGRTAIWKDQIPNCLHQNHIFKARIVSNQIDGQWVEKVLNSNIGREYFAGASKQTTNLASINMSQLRSFAFPIPPLQEQKEILKKAQSLLSLCDTLQKQLEKFRTIAEQLAQSVVDSITGQSTEKQVKMKAPKTELVTKLKLVKKPGAKQHAPLSAILARHSDELSAKSLWNTSGLGIDDFYRQLKTEMVNGWIEEPEKARVRIVEDLGTPT